MKKLLGILFALTTLTTATAFGSDISIEIMGNKLESEVAPLIIEGRTMVPVRAIFEGVGAEVNWNGETKTVTGTMADTVVTMTIDSNTVSINGSDVTMDASPLIIDGRTYAPARYVAESFGYSVDWDSTNKIVKINSAETTIEEITDITTEATTEELTEATTEELTEATAEAEEIKSYSGSELKIGVDIPAGTYIVEAVGSPFAKVNIYDFIKQPEGKINDVYTYIENRGIIELESHKIVSIENGRFMTIEDAPKADLTKNGAFVVGKDIAPGKYTFKKSEYVDKTVFWVDEGVEEVNPFPKTEVRSYSEDQGYFNRILNEGDHVYKYGLDVYKDDELLYKYEPDKKTFGDYSQYDFSEIDSYFKTSIISAIKEKINNCNFKTIGSATFTKANYDNTVKSWYSRAKNESEKKFAEMASYILDRHRNLYAKGLGSAEVDSYDERLVGGGYYTKAYVTEYKEEYEDVLVDDEFMRITKALEAAESFEDCEICVNNVTAYYYGYGTGNLYDTKYEYKA